MKPASKHKSIALPFLGIFIIACTTQNPPAMTEVEINNTISEVKSTYSQLMEHSKKAELDSFLSYYDSSPYFQSISADGNMSNYEAFKEACSGYYNSLRKQSITTTKQEFQVVERDLVIVSWTGDIIADLKNGDTIRMINYSITSVFKKKDSQWKIVHDHESALPPTVTKKGE